MIICISEVYNLMAQHLKLNHVSFIVLKNLSCSAIGWNLFLDECLITFKTSLLEFNG